VPTDARYDPHRRRPHRCRPSLISPRCLQDDLPVRSACRRWSKRAALTSRYPGRSRRPAGRRRRPCSIHDHDQALEYANFLRPPADELRDDLLIVNARLISKRQDHVVLVYRTPASRSADRRAAVAAAFRGSRIRVPGLVVIEHGPTTATSRSSRPSRYRHMSTRLFSTSVCTLSDGQIVFSSAGEISGRTAPMRTSSMRVVSCVESARPPPGRDTGCRGRLHGWFSEKRGDSPGLSHLAGVFGRGAGLGQVRSLRLLRTVANRRQTLTHAKTTYTIPLDGMGCLTMQRLKYWRRG